MILSFSFSPHGPMMAAIAPSITASPDNRVSFPTNSVYVWERVFSCVTPSSYQAGIFFPRSSPGRLSSCFRPTERQLLAKGNARTMIHLDQWFSNLSVLVKPWMAYSNTDLWASPPRPWFSRSEIKYKYFYFYQVRRYADVAGSGATLSEPLN